MFVNSCRIFLSKPCKRIHISCRRINIAGKDSAPKNRWKPDNSPSAFAYALGVLPIATFALGTWQCYRLNWKLDLIEKLEKFVKSSPIELPEDLNDAAEYTKYRVKGHFDLSMQPIFIFPRQIIDNKNSHSAGGGLISQSNATHLGAHMIVPFVITDGRFQNKRILVNVGWIPKKTMEFIQKNDLQTNPITQLNETEIELIGVLRTSEKRQPFQQKNHNKNEYLSRRNIQKLSEILETEEIFLDGHSKNEFMLKNESIVPIDSQTRVTLRNEHLSYILTWYSLTAIFSYLWYSKIFRTRL